MNLYYAIIGDALHSVRKTSNRNSWKSSTIIVFAIYLYFNILTLFVAIDLFLGYNIMNEIEYHLRPILAIQYSSFVIMFILCLCIIYFLVFYKKKYIYIYRKYKYRKGKLFIAYITASSLLFFGIALCFLL